MTDDFSTISLADVDTKEKLQDAINRTKGRVSIIKVDGDVYTLRICNYYKDKDGKRVRVEPTGHYTDLPTDKRPFKTTNEIVVVIL